MSSHFRSLTPGTPAKSWAFSPAIIEWTIAFGFTFYLLTFFFDLRMSKGVHKGELSRQRLLAMQQNGQSIAAAREANQGDGAMPDGYDGHAHGYHNGVGANGYGNGVAANGIGTNGYSNGYPQGTQMSHANGPTTFGSGGAPISYPVNARAANRANIAYP